MRATSTLLLLALAAIAHAQQADLPDADLTVDPRDAMVPPAPRAELMPIVWFASLAGDVSIAPGDLFEIENVNADEPHFAGGADLRLDSDRLTFAISGFHLGASESNQRVGEAFTAGTIAVGAGDRVDWDLELTSIDITAGYQFRDILPDAPDTDLSFDLYGGLRYVDLSFELSPAAGGSAAFDERWAVPIVGVRARLDLPYDFGVLIESDIGWLPLGDTTAFSWEAFAGVSWTPIENVGLRAGFRHQSIRYFDESDDGDTEFSGFLAGLYAGVVISF